MAQDNTGMVQRGVFLFALLAAIAVVTLFAVFYRAPAPEKAAPRSELSLSALTAPAIGFPASVNWAAVREAASLMPSPPGWAIRYNAARSLAYLGSSQVPLDIIAEMLDEDLQVRNNVRVKDGRSFVDQASAQKIVIGGLKAVRAWHNHPRTAASVDRADPDLQKVQLAVERLCRSSDRVVQSEAEQTKLALRKS